VGGFALRLGQGRGSCVRRERCSLTVQLAADKSEIHACVEEWHVGIGAMSDDFEVDRQRIFDVQISRRWMRSWKSPDEDLVATG
jgi:Tfp pilus assembly protein FimT